MDDRLIRHIFAMFASVFMVATLSSQPVQGVFSSITVSASNPNVIPLGELTLIQLLLLGVAFLKIVVLTAVGVLPVSVSFKGLADSLNYFLTGEIPSRTVQTELESPFDSYYPKYPQSRSLPAAEISTFLLDCPLQFVCDVDAWANRDHEYFMERVLASWFRNPNQTWHHKNAAVFGGGGTCKEMYPCPFDVQEVVGIRIPGSNYLTSEGNEVNEEESLSFF